MKLFHLSYLVTFYFGDRCHCLSESPKCTSRHTCYYFSSHLLLVIILLGLNVPDSMIILNWNIFCSIQKWVLISLCLTQILTTSQSARYLWNVLTPNNAGYWFSIGIKLTYIILCAYYVIAIFVIRVVNCLSTELYLFVPHQPSK